MANNELKVNWYDLTKEERRAALVDFIKSMQCDENGDVKKDAIPLSQEDLMSALIDYYPTYDETRDAHNQGARLILLGDLRAINMDPRYPFLKTTPYTMILTGTNAFNYLKKRMNSLSNSFTRLKQMAVKLGYEDMLPLIGDEHDGQRTK